MKYVYPAIFTKEKCGYSVRFPNLEGCVTSGENLEETMSMAEDALCLMLYDMEENGQPPPTASDISSLRCNDDEFVSLVACNTSTAH